MVKSHCRPIKDSLVQRPQLVVPLFVCQVERDLAVLKQVLVEVVLAKQRPTPLQLCLLLALVLDNDADNDAAVQ